MTQGLVCASGAFCPDHGAEAVQSGKEAGTPFHAGEPAKQRSYLEIEITPLRMSIFERSGDRQTAALLEALARLGLKLRERVSSPCG